MKPENGQSFSSCNILIHYCSEFASSYYPLSYFIIKSILDWLLTI